MATSGTTSKIHTVEGRSRLAPRKAPYWQKLQSGGAIGFRKSTSGQGTWIGQWYDPSTRKQHRFTIGDLAHLPPSQRYDQAVKEIQNRLTHLERGGTVETITVGDACRDYIQHLASQDRAAAAADHSARFRRHVLSTQLANVLLTKLKRSHLDLWRANLIKADVKVNTAGETRARSPSSVNRDMTALRAALNFAMDQDHVTTDSAWAAALLPIKGADKPRDIYLDRDQRDALIAAATDEIRPYLSGLSALPLRPGTIAKLTVRDVDMQRGTLRVSGDKGHSQTIKLGDKTAALLKENCAGKMADQPIFAKASGAAWNKDTWKGAIKRAVKAAGVDEAVTAYTFRHSLITDLIISGHDPLTVARLSGTSLPMIQKHYGHLTNKQAANALDSLL